MTQTRFWDELKVVQALQEQGEHNDAVSVLRRMEQGAGRGEDIMLQDSLGRSLYALGLFSEALLAFDAAVQSMKQHFGPHHPHVAAATINVARVRAARGEHVEAVRLGEEAIASVRSSLGDEHPQLADMLLNVSSFCYEGDDFAKAEAFLLEAQRIWTATLGPECFEISTCLNNLGRLHERRGENAKGALLHKEAVRMRRFLLGDHAETAFSLTNWGAALAGAEQWAEAVSALEQALDCYARLGLEQGQGAQACRDNLALCRKALDAGS